MQSSRIRKTFSGLLIFAFVAFAAVAFGQYVYPHQPVLVWGLLFFLWACYRLRMLAVARFGPQTKLEAPAFPDQRS